ncbi:MAG: ATP-dependent DNA ligase [Saprospiraceae bacterium]|nr:ATP-dependent DNA ligase [Saprospiraceae bacterium]MDP5089652.1 ATP-dependent DNA ligase [Saprospiraceae bacterium]
MRYFETLFLCLEETTKTNEKVSALIDYLSSVPDEDKMWMIGIFSGRRPKRTVSTKNLRRWAAEKADIPLWLFEDSYHIVGDLSETIALLLPPPAIEVQKSLNEWIQLILSLDKMEEDEQREMVFYAWDSLNTSSRFIFNKLITGGFRVGVSQKLMAKALAEFTHIDPSDIALKLMGEWSPLTYSFQSLIENEGSHSRPYPFHLAYSINEVTDLKGEPADWVAEYKWDGIRGQAIFRHGQYFLWSRGEELITDKFPEFEHLISVIPPGTVLDGEILPFKDGLILPFQHIQTRVSRKKITAAILKVNPVVFRVYDLLEWEGKDIRSKPFIGRRTLLDQLFTSIDSSLPLQLSSVLPFDEFDELKILREASSENGSEGLMLKNKHSNYSAGRKKGEWWKWKIDPFTVDAILIYAQSGHGRRANLYTDFTFAVYSPEGDLLPFTKAYSGLTDKEFIEINQWIKKNTLERFGPVRKVTAELVFEIAFEGIQESKRHKSGIALRFPRMVRWRKDKVVAEANTLEDLQLLLKKSR